MNDVVNLNQFRKRTARDQAAKRAEINRARFGRTKAARQREQDQSDRTAKTLDQHRLAPEEQR